MLRDCVVLFTHVWSPALERHVARLRRETAGQIEVFLVLHAEPSTPVPDGVVPDFTVSLASARELMPYRAAQLEQRGWVGHIEQVWLSALLHPRLAGYDRIWLLEYDVDLKGDWGRFFRAAATYDGDLLATRIRRLSEDPNWFHAPQFNRPPAVVDPLIGLFCFSRLSRPLAEAYAAAVARSGWDGHFEAILPSFAEHAGFTVAEIGGRGSWTPPERTDRHYSGHWYDMASWRTTYSFRPPHAFRYLADHPFDPGDRDILYHPVKTDVTAGERFGYFLQDMRAGLRAAVGRQYR